MKKKSMKWLHFLQIIELNLNIVEARVKIVEVLSAVKQYPLKWAGRRGIHLNYTVASQARRGGGG